MADIVVQFKGTVYENGYGQIAQRVMRDKTIHVVAKAIYSYLVSFAGQDGNAFPSVELMKDELGIKTDDTFYKYRKQLIDAGYITIEKQQRINGRFYNNVYTIELVPKAKTTEDKPHPKKSSTVPHPKFSRTVKSDTTNSSTTSINSLQKTTIHKKQKNNNTDIVVAIESQLGKSIKSLLPKLKEWVEEYGTEYLLEKAKYVGSKRGKLGNIIGAYVAAVTEDYETAFAEVAATKEPSSDKNHDRYQALYHLFPDSSEKATDDRYQAFFDLFPDA